MKHLSVSRIALPSVRLTSDAADLGCYTALSYPETSYQVQAALGKYVWPLKFPPRTSG